MYVEKMKMMYIDVDPHLIFPLDKTFADNATMQVHCDALLGNNS